MQTYFMILSLTSFRSRPQFSGTNFLLMTTFPNKELTDETQTLTAANLLNAVLVQKAK